MNAEDVILWSEITSYERTQTLPIPMQTHSLKSVSTYDKRVVKRLRCSDVPHSLDEAGSLYQVETKLAFSPKPLS